MPPHGPQTRLGDLVLPKARLNVEHQQASLRRCQKKVLGRRAGDVTARAAAVLVARR